MSDEELVGNQLVTDNSTGSLELDQPDGGIPITRHEIRKREAVLNATIATQQAELETASAELGHLRSEMLEALTEGAGLCSDIYRACLHVKAAKRVPAEQLAKIDEHIQFCTDLKTELEAGNEGMRDTVENTKPLSENLMRETRQLSDLNRRLHQQLDEGTADSDMQVISRLNDRIDEQMTVLQGMRDEFEAEMDVRRRAKEELLKRLRSLGAPGFEEEEPEYYSEVEESEGSPVSSGRAAWKVGLGPRSQSVHVFNVPHDETSKGESLKSKASEEKQEDQDILLSDDEISASEGMKQPLVDQDMLLEDDEISANEDLKKPLVDMADQDMLLGDDEISANEDFKKPLVDMADQDMLLDDDEISANEDFKKPLIDMADQDMLLDDDEISANEDFKKPLIDMADQDMLLEDDEISANEDLKKPLMLLADRNQLMGNDEISANGASSENYLLDSSECD